MTEHKKVLKRWAVYDIISKKHDRENYRLKTVRKKMNQANMPGFQLHWDYTCIAKNKTHEFDANSARFSSYRKDEKTVQFIR